MKYIFSIAFIFVCLFQLEAQDRVFFNIDSPANRLAPISNKYAVNEVFDQRRFAGNIGYVKTGSQKYYEADLKDGVSKQFESYLNYKLKGGSDAHKLNFIIKDLRIRQVNNLYDELGIARLNLVITEEGGSNEQELELVALSEDRGNNLSDTHSKRIQDVIDQCVMKYILIKGAEEELIGDYDDSAYFFKPIEIVKGLRPHYIFLERRYFGLDDLKWVLFSVDDEEVGENYRKYEFYRKSSWPVAIIGSALVGYTLYDRFFGGSDTYNLAAAGTGGTLLIGSMIIQMIAKKYANETVRAYNRSLGFPEDGKILITSFRIQPDVSMNYGQVNYTLGVKFNF